jgi:hypothetical protein
MNRVFVVHNQYKKTDDGFLVPKYDLNIALEWGNLTCLLSPSASPFHPERIVPELQHKLKDFTKNDYLLLVGNPVLIGMATAIAARASGGEVQMLQWNGRDQRYIPVKTSLFTS